MAGRTLQQQLAVLFLAGTCGVAPLRAQSAASTTLQLRIGPECDISVVSSTKNPQPDGYSGQISFTYRIRTSTAGGSGAIDLTLFGSGMEGARLSYKTALAGAGEARSLDRSAFLRLPAAVALFGLNAHSSKSGDSGTVAWALENYRGASPAVRLTIRCH